MAGAGSSSGSRGRLGRWRPGPGHRADGAPVLLGEQTGGGVLGLAARLLLALLARLLFGLPLDRSQLLGAAAGLVGGQAPGVVLGPLARLLLDLLGVDERAHAAVFSSSVKRLQHHRAAGLSAPGLGRRPHDRRRFRAAAPPASTPSPGRAAADRGRPA